MKTISINNINIGNNQPLVLVAGPCVIEDEKTTLNIAETLIKISKQNNIPLIFKSSYEKDNRSTVEKYRGPGLKRGLSILSRIRNEFNVPVITDVHRESDIPYLNDIVDIIQIPAFLCQQTSLLLAAAKTMKPIAVKKGQFLSPENMISPVSKILSTGNENILLTERGTCFGYNHLVSDICCIPTMQQLGFPVLYDVTHIIRVYGVPSDNVAGGKPQFIKHLARSGTAAGADGLFIETHSSPADALCDAASMLDINLLPDLLKTVIPISKIVRQ